MSACHRAAAATAATASAHAAWEAKIRQVAASRTQGKQMTESDWRALVESLRAEQEERVSEVRAAHVRELEALRAARHHGAGDGVEQLRARCEAADAERAVFEDRLATQGREYTSQLRAARREWDAKWAARLAKEREDAEQTIRELKAVIHSMVQATSALRDSVCRARDAGGL